MSKLIYLDHAATTPLDPGVYRVMQPYLRKEFGNPSALYTLGRVARGAIEEARVRTAAILECSSHEILFMSGGTESCNAAIFGVTAAQPTKKHIITQATEHKAVLEPIRALERRGYRVTVLPVDPNGVVDPRAVEAAIGNDTALVSIMYVNNEIGSINDIAAIAKICRRKKVPLHSDACQAGNLLPLQVTALGIDLLTINGSKIYGPKGSAILYLRDGTPFVPLLYGGGQERGLRSGTENVAAIVGFSHALVQAQDHRRAEVQHLKHCKKALVGALAQIPAQRINGSLESTLASTLSVSFKGVDAEKLVALLDDEGVVVGMGSACDAASLSASHVLVAVQVPEDERGGTIRFSMGRDTTLKAIARVGALLPRLIQRLRAAQGNAIAS